MRPVVFLAALLVLLLPVSTVASGVRTPSTQTSNVKASPAQTNLSTAPKPSTNLGLSTTPPTGLVVIIRSVFGLAFYNSSGKITIQPASLFLNMTVKGSNSTGIIFSVNSGRISIGPSPIVSVPRVFTVISGQAFLAYYGRLTIQAQMTEAGLPPVPNNLYQLYLTGPSRLVSPTPQNNSWGLFTRLFGFLFNSQTRIGLFFVVGISLADLNEDGRVDISDLAIVAASFGADTMQASMAAPSTTNTGYSSAFYADLDGDGHVDIQDMVIVASHFGQSY